MEIKFEFSGLTITIEANGVTKEIDAIMIAGDILDKTQELGYGAPKFSWKKDVKMSDLQIKNEEGERPKKDV